MPILGSSANTIDFSGIKLPFTLNEVLSVSMGLLGIVSLFVLLGLAFKFVPKWIGLAFTAISGGGGKRA